MILKMKQSGFTLIEVMVALAVVGLALPALLFQVMGNVDTEAYLRDKALAQWVAENRLAETRLMRSMGQRVLSGTASGIEEMGGRRWQWRVQSLPTSVPGMRRLQFEVGPQDQESLISLVGFIHE
jgi:general secretion pathway protein I